MNSIVVVVFAILAVANAGLIATPAIGALQGPSSRTTVVGPDGSQISAVQPGGTVVADPYGGTVVAQGAPAVVAQAAAALVAPAVVAHGVPLTYAAPFAYGHHGLYL